MFIRRYIWMLLSLCLLTGCSFRSLHETLSVVGEADSLWQQGQMYDDSVRLAQAYSTLRVWRTFYADAYAHACYHYGKLLRANDDPVAAMQVFIDATHSRTRDYHILGRVYSNMGSICHLAGDFPLAYDMYERSGEMYLQNADTLLYYYDLSNMAFELAEQGKKDSTLALCKIIEDNNTDMYVLAKIWEAKALLYRNIKQYDSVICAVDQMVTLTHDVQPTGLTLKAYAFWMTEQRDSALYYAKCVLSMTNASLQDKYNVLYVLMKSGDSKHTEEIKSISERRADLQTQKLIPLHKQNAVASSMLQYDLDNQSIYIYVLLLVGIVVLVVCIIWIYVGRIKRSQKRQQIILNSVKQRQVEQNQYKQHAIESVCQYLRSKSNWQQEIDWNNYDLLCEYVNKHFFFLAQALKERNVLNEKEIRLCFLVMIGGFTDKQMAGILWYGEKSIRSIKRITAHKLGTNAANLRHFLINLTIENTIA